MESTSDIFKHLRRVLSKAYFLQALNQRELDKVVDCLRAMRVFKGYEIVRQGEAGDAFYFIASGWVSVWVTRGARRVKVADLGPDQYFGEMALISNQPRNATVVAEGLTELFVMQKFNFDCLFMKNPAISQKIREAYRQRQAVTSSLAAE
jgi:CRP-like cAMP-binding protein